MVMYCGTKTAGAQEGKKKSLFRIYLETQMERLLNTILDIYSICSAV